MIFLSKKFLVLYTVFTIVLLILLGVFIGDSSLHAIPNLDPLYYLNSIPYFNLNIGSDVITIIKPSSTFFVYLLGVITILLGVSFLKDRKVVSKKWWGVSMILWGTGAILAGTSYQGLGYELKCDGLSYCMYTSWFELAYLYITALSILSLMVAIVYSSANLQVRKISIYVAVISLFAYGTLLLKGTISDNRFLMSYEFFVICFMPHFIYFFILNVIEYKKNKDEMNKLLIYTWLIFLVVNVLYFVFLLAETTMPLYENTGIWFSENDILHIALIFWMLFIWLYVKEKIKDYN